MRTLLRVARDGFSAMDVLEEVTEDNLLRDMQENKRELGFYVSNMKELERALGKEGVYLRELAEGEAYDLMDIVEGLGEIVQGKVLADTAKPGNGLSAALNAFLEMLRGWVLQAKALFEAGVALNKVLEDKEAAAKLEPEFREVVENLARQDVEWLQKLQMKEGLEAMARASWAAATGKASTPILDEAEAEYGEEVRAEMAAKEEQQRKVDADVAAGEAALEGTTASMVNQEEAQAAGFARDMRGLVSGGAVTLHNAQHGDILYEVGNPESFGAYHVIQRRMQQGFSEDEAARIAVLVGWTAMKGTPNRHFKNRKELDRNNVRAVVAIDPNGDEIITGFAILNNRYRKKDKGAGASTGAHSSQTSYTSVGLNSVQQMGAALARSIEWFEDIVKKN